MVGDRRYPGEEVVEYWIGFGGLLEGPHDWTEGIFVVTRQRRTLSYFVRFTGELQRKWRMRDRDSVVEVIKRYGYQAIRNELSRGREADGVLLMLSSDTCLEKDSSFLRMAPYELPPDDLMRFTVHLEGGPDQPGKGTDVRS